MLSAMDPAWPPPQDTMRVLLSALEDVARRRAQLACVVPLFGGILAAAAYFGVPSTRVPVMIVALAVLASLAYLEIAKRRLRSLAHGVWQDQHHTRRVRPARERARDPGGRDAA